MIELAAVIKNLRHELYLAIDEGKDERLQFDLGPVELELSMAVEQTDGIHGKIRFWVVDLGGEMSDKNLAAQKIKLKLLPTVQLSEGRRVTPKVSGEAEEGED
jgi:hypothetical protein